MNSRMSGDPLEITQLIDPHSQRDSHFGVEPRRRPPGVAFDEEIQLRLEPQRAKHDLRRQPGVTRIEPGRARKKKVGRIPAAIHLQENFESERSRWRHYWPFGMAAGGFAPGALKSSALFVCERAAVARISFQTRSGTCRKYLTTSGSNCEPE